MNNDRPYLRAFMVIIILNHYHNHHPSYQFVAIRKACRHNRRVKGRGVNGRVIKDYGVKVNYHNPFKGFNLAYF